MSKRKNYTTHVREVLRRLQRKQAVEAGADTVVDVVDGTHDDLRDRRVSAAPVVDPTLLSAQQAELLMDVASRHRTTVDAIERVAARPGASDFLAPFAELTLREGQQLLRDIAFEQRSPDGGISVHAEGGVISKPETGP